MFIWIKKLFKLFILTINSKMICQKLSQTELGLLQKCKNSEKIPTPI